MKAAVLEEVVRTEVDAIVEGRQATGLSAPSEDAPAQPPTAESEPAAEATAAGYDTTDADLRWFEMDTRI